jgi:hypothetical protein
MDYRVQSYLTVSIVLAIMIVVGLSIGQLENTITGAAVHPACNCTVDSDCNDNNPNTADTCVVNKDDCQNSYCNHIG